MIQYLSSLDIDGISPTTNWDTMGEWIAGMQWTIWRRGLGVPLWWTNMASWNKTLVEHRWFSHVDSSAICGCPCQRCLIPKKKEIIDLFGGIWGYFDLIENVGGTPAAWSWLKSQRFSAAQSVKWQDWMSLCGPIIDVLFPLVGWIVAGFNKAL